MAEADLAKQMKQLRSDVDDLRKQIAKQSDALTRRGRKTASQMRRRAEEGYEHAAEAATDLVERHPVTLLLSLLGVGVLLAVLLSRRD